MSPLVRRAIPGALALAVLLAVAGPAWAVVPHASIGPSLSPSYPVRGDLVTCNKGFWNNDPGGANAFQYAFAWLRDGQPVGGQTASTYQTAGADQRHTLQCRVTVTDPQTNSQTVTTSEVVTVAPPAPTINIAPYSSVIDGNIGSSNAVGVTVTLMRSSIVVATASTTSAGDGTWTVTLPGGHALADDRDVLKVDYDQNNPEAPYNSQLLGLDQGYVLWFARHATGITPDGATLTAFCGSSYSSGLALTPTTILVDAGSQAASACAPSGFWSISSTTLSSAVTTEQDVRVLFTGVVNHLDDQGRHAGRINLRVTAPAGLPAGDAAPSCFGDLSIGRVSCRGLRLGSSYTLSRVRAGSPPSSVVLDATANDVYLGGASGAASFPAPSLKPDDVITLKAQGGSRTLSTLVVANLRLDLDGLSVIGGTCPALEWFAAVDGTDVLCPASGNATGLAISGPVEDEGHVGETQVKFIPRVDETAPIEGETIRGAFTAFADVSAPTANDLGNTRTPSTAVTTLDITPRSGGASVFHGDNVNLDNGATVPELTPGRYRARWTVTDVNGDTRRLDTYFIAQSGQAGSQGATGPAGPAGATGGQGPAGVQGPAGAKGDTGARGPAGRDAVVHCRVTGTKRLPKVKCTVSLQGASRGLRLVHLRLHRGSRVLAMGKGAVRRGRTTVRMYVRTAPKRGRYAVVIVGRDSRGRNVTLHGVAQVA